MYPLHLNDFEPINDIGISKGYRPEVSISLILSFLDLAIHSVGEQYRSRYPFHDFGRHFDPSHSPESVHYWHFSRWICFAPAQTASRLILQIRGVQSVFICMLYSENGDFPEDLGTLIKKGRITISLCVSPLSKTQPPPSNWSMPAWTL